MFLRGSKGNIAKKQAKLGFKTNPHKNHLKKLSSVVIILIFVQYVKYLHSEKHCKILKYTKKRQFKNSWKYTLQQQLY